MKIVITGGHHTSALPIIKKLKEYSDIEIVWFGVKNSLKGDKNIGLEYKEISALNIAFYNIKAGKFYNTLDFKRLLKIPFGFFQTLYLLFKIKPDLILSFGGYIAVPTVLSAWLLNIPSITHEQTVVSGWANKFISKFAKKVLISWPNSAKYFDPKKTVLTGIPLRPEIFELNSDLFKAKNDLPYIYVTGGKTGSHILNFEIQNCLQDLLEFCNVIHQTGDYSVINDYDVLEQKYDSIKEKVKGEYFLRKFVFLNEIGSAYGKASLVVARSGAHTIYDLGALHKPCVLVPIPWVSHNEQYKNALVLKDAGLAEIIEEKNINSKRLLETIQNMLNDIKKYANVPKSDFIKNDATNLIVDEILKYRKTKI